MTNKANFLKVVQEENQWIIIDLNRSSEDGDWYWNTEKRLWVDNTGEATRFTNAERASFNITTDMQWVNWTELQRVLARSRLFHPTSEYIEPRLSLLTDDSDS